MVVATPSRQTLALGAVIRIRSLYGLSQGTLAEDPVHQRA